MHKVEVEPSPTKLPERVSALGAKARQVALLETSLDGKVDPAGEGAPESVVFKSYSANRMAMDVRAGSRGLVVLSEIFYPGWNATVNGRPARIYKVDGGLRGILVPAGQSRVVVHYAPVWVYAGAVLTILTFAGVFAVRLFVRPREIETERADTMAA